MSIQATTNNPSIDWSTLLGKLDAATKAAGAQGASGVTAGQNVTITATVDGAQRAVTFPVPDDLPLPATVDQAAIDSLCAKLAGDTSLGLTEADIKAVHKALSGALAAIAPSITQGSKNVMFDLYKLMALLVEVGQKQRDATREIRSAQSQLVQKSIQDQADNQRLAALTGMILGAITCGIQVAVSIVMLKSQTKDFNKQIKTLDSTGVSSAKDNLSMLKTADTQQHAQAQLNKVTNEVGAKPAGNHGRTIAQDVGEYGFSKTEQTLAKYQTAKVTKTVQTDRLSRIQNGQVQAGDVPADSDLAKAQTKLAAFDQKAARIAELEAKPVRTQAETRELLELQQGFDPTSRPQLVQDVEAGRAKLIGEVRGQIQAAEADIAKYKGQFNESVKSDLQRYEDEYSAALRDANGITDDTPAAEANKIRSDLQLATDKLKFARAYAYERMAQPEFANAGARALDIKLAGDAIDKAEQARTTDLGYLKATRSLQKGEAKLSIVNALGNAGQNLVQNLSSFLQAKSKDLEAEATRVQDELDQTKELFNQAQQLVDAVVQLMQAISSAENQSMRDAIQA